MRRVIIACFLSLAGCASNPADLVGKPLDDAISLYGNPVSAVDYEGARAFYFEIGDKAKNTNKQEVKKILNPDMPILGNNFSSSGCVYTANALWTGAYKQWVIHSLDQSPQCQEKNKEKN